MCTFKWNRFVPVILVGLICATGARALAFADDGDDKPPAEPAVCLCGLQLAERKSTDQRGSAGHEILYTGNSFGRGLRLRFPPSQGRHDWRFERSVSLQRSAAYATWRGRRFSLRQCACARDDTIWFVFGDDAAR